MQHLESVHWQVAWLTSKIDGAGLIQIPKAYVARELAAKTLIGVLGDCVQPKVDRFFVYYSSRRQMRPALKALINFLRGAYARLKGLGIEPLWVADHGVGTAIYYEDPHGNIVEINVNNYVLSESLAPPTKNEFRTTSVQ